MTLKKATMACSICLQGIPRHQKLTTDCNHTFCSPCMLTWANKSDRNIHRRFHAIGRYPKDHIPIVSCPLCRKDVHYYITATYGYVKINYAYDGNPYQLRIGGLVYYYQRLRQPGGKRAGSIGILRKISNTMMTIQCVWPDKDAIHEVRSYCVFDILALELPGSIPTRKQMNQFFVSDNLGQGFITESAYQFAPLLRLEDMRYIRKLMIEYNNNTAKPSLISPLCRRLQSVDFFLDVTLQNAIHDIDTTNMQLKRLPDPCNTIDLSPYFETLQTYCIGLNQARVILAYYEQGYNADAEDTPLVLKTLFGSSGHLHREPG